MQPEEQRGIEMKEMNRISERCGTPLSNADICKMRIPGEDRGEQKKYLLKTP